MIWFFMLSRVLLRFAIFLQVFTLRDERYVPSALRPIVGPVVHFRHVLCHTCWTCVLGARFPHAATATTTATIVAVGVFSWWFCVGFLAPFELHLGVCVPFWVEFCHEILCRVSWFWLTFHAELCMVHCDVFKMILK